MVMRWGVFWIDRNCLKNAYLVQNQNTKEKGGAQKEGVQNKSDGFIQMLTRFHLKYEEVIIFSEYLEWFESQRMVLYSLSLCYASGKPVRTLSNPTVILPSPLTWATERAPQLFKQQPGQGQCCEMVKTFVKRDSLPYIRSGPYIPEYDGIYQGSSKPARHALW